MLCLESQVVHRDPSRAKWHRPQTTKRRGSEQEKDHNEIINYFQNQTKLYHDEAFPWIVIVNLHVAPELPVPPSVAILIINRAQICLRPTATATPLLRGPNRTHGVPHPPLYSPIAVRRRLTQENKEPQRIPCVATPRYPMEIPRSCFRPLRDRFKRQNHDFPSSLMLSNTLKRDSKLKGLWALFLITA